MPQYVVLSVKARYLRSLRSHPSATSAATLPEKVASEPAGTTTSLIVGMQLPSCTQRIRRRPPVRCAASMSDASIWTSAARTTGSMADSGVVPDGSRTTSSWTRRPLMPSSSPPSQAIVVGPGT